MEWGEGETTWKRHTPDLTKEGTSTTGMQGMRGHADTKRINDVPTGKRESTIRDRNFTINHYMEYRNNIRTERKQGTN